MDDESGSFRKIKCLKLQKVRAVLNVPQSWAYANISKKAVVRK